MSGVDEGTQGRNRDLRCTEVDQIHRSTEPEALGARRAVFATGGQAAVLREGLAALIVAHNHPSGVAEPSTADAAVTLRLRDALALVEVRLLDHFVVGDDEPVSLAERGVL